MMDMTVSPITKLHALRSRYESLSSLLRFFSTEPIPAEANDRGKTQILFKTIPEPFLLTHAHMHSKLINLRYKSV